MKSTHSHILKAVIATVIACTLVFALALYIFGIQGFWVNQSPILSTGSNIPNTSDTMVVPVVVDTTSGSVQTGGIMNCTREYTPVCGTDGKTYANACIANSEGTIVATEGICPSIGAHTGVVSDTGSRVCTQEYTPVCGTDSKTYSNICMAGDIAIAHMGECTTANSSTVFDTGSYLIYTNAGIGYSFAMPKYAYYAGAGARDGARHTVMIATTASGTIDFSSAPIQVWFYTKAPITPPSDQSVTTENGILYIHNNDTTGNLKIGKIIETVLQSAK